MRLKLGRPDLRDYAGYFDAPAADAGSSVTVTWAGVTTLLIADSDSAIMTDGFFSRPNLLAVGTRRLAPSLPRIDGSTIPLTVESVCVHGDSPGAVRIATAVRDRLVADGLRLEAFV